MRNNVVTGAALVLVLAFGLGAAGEPGDDFTFRFRDESAPAGGTVQMKLEDTDGTPISGGRPTFTFDQSMFRLDLTGSF